MKKDLYFPYLAVVGIVAIIALVSLVLFNGSIEGAHIYREQADEFTENCVDEEPANDKYVAGVVKEGIYDYHDYCLDDMLYQFHCDKLIVRPVGTYRCPNGCLEGACIG